MRQEIAKHLYVYSKEEEIIDYLASQGHSLMLAHLEQTDITTLTLLICLANPGPQQAKTLSFNLSMLIRFRKADPNGRMILLTAEDYLYNRLRHRVQITEGKLLDRNYARDLGHLLLVVARYTGIEVGKIIQSIAERTKHQLHKSGITWGEVFVFKDKEESAIFCLSTNKP